MSFFNKLKNKIEETIQSNTPTTPQQSLSSSQHQRRPSQQLYYNYNNEQKTSPTSTTTTSPRTSTQFDSPIFNNNNNTLSPSSSSTDLFTQYHSSKSILESEDNDKEDKNYIINIWGNGMKKDGSLIEFSELFQRQKIVLISAGAIHAALITNLGNLYTFGDGLLGKLGHGDQESCQIPQLVEYFQKQSIKIIQVSTGGKHTLALSDQNELYSWGGNDSCQLGNGSSQSFQSTPQKIPTVYNNVKCQVERLSCSTTRSAFVTRDGLLFTWGRGDHGRLGHGDTLMQSTPKQVMALHGHHIVDISSGGGHSMALTSRGEVFSWGRGENGQLGHGGIIAQQLKPKQIMELSGKFIRLISAGGYHSFAVQDNGDVYSWGRSDYGVLGNGTLEVGDKTTPFLLQTFPNCQQNPIIQLSSGFQHNIAILQDKSLYSWGCGAGGRLNNIENQENLFLPKKCQINFQPTLISCGEIITIIIGKQPRSIQKSPVITSPVSSSNINSNSIPNQLINNSIELPKITTPLLLNNNITHDIIRRSSSPTPSFVSLASDKTLPGKDLLLNTQSHFIEWLSRISKSKEILSIIQTKITSSGNISNQQEQSIEKKIIQYDDINKSIRSQLALSNSTSGNDLDVTIDQRNKLSQELLDTDINQSIEYWLDIHQQKESIHLKLSNLIKQLNSNNNSNSNNNNNNNISINDNDIQKSSNYLIEKLNESLSLFLMNINDSVNSGQMESLRLSMEALQFIVFETIKYAEKYLYQLSNTLTQSQSLMNQRKSKKMEIQTQLDKQKEAMELIDQREKLKMSYRVCKRNSIELSKRIEVLELDDDDGGGSRGDMKPDDQLIQIKETLNKLKKDEQKLMIQQQDLNTSLQEIIDRYAPELRVTVLKQQEKLSNRVKDTGLVLIERKFNSYDIVKTLSTHPHNVYLASFGGDNQLVVLKEFGIGDQMGKQMFERQVSLMKQMNHICIMPIQAVFYDRNAFIQMEYIEGGDLVQWLRLQERKPWEIQKVFQQIIQGIAYMHSNGIIHRDLKLENILLKEGTIPVISDFDLSKDLNGLQTNVTMFQGGTELYKAPEMKELGVMGSYATDIWAFGVMLYKSNFPKGREPILLPEESSIPIPSHNDQRLRSLLQQTLQRNPSLRPTSHQITVHPYFVTSPVEDLLQSRTLVDSREKIAAFRAHISSILEISEDINDSLQMTIERETLIRDVFQFFKKIETNKLFQRLEVTFKGEKGLDHGGLTSEMYSIFLNNSTVKIPLHYSDDNNNNNTEPHNIGDNEKSIFSKRFNLFESSQESPFYLLQSQPLDMNDQSYPLSVMQREQILYRTLGRIFLKSVIDGRVIPDVFPPSFFKFLLDIKPNLQDLEVYDPPLAMSFKKVLVLDNIQDYLSTTFDGLVEGGEEIAVTDSNKVDFIQKNIERVLIGCRQSQMEAFKAGFMSIESLNAHFQLFSSTELQLLMCGNTIVDANLLKKSLKFIGFPEQSSTPKYFTRVLDEMSQDELHMFLRFLTGMVAIPLQGLEKPLSIVYVPKSDKLPVSHTCSYQLDLPDYNDYTQLKKKILQMIEWLDSGFSFI
ncbi:putative protein serine/threonine kinase [Tieghemostelium lacteum]|uniref:Regulator of chromosome condensation domain-containing protein n=1 Tax=Tieghemostelium lacteum TaxID=361077 RepID=A0A151Z6S6_TIELA|nr:putative protein serine/threonine kinase [Tieghemostelium lacteum]|eukprot:KYQ89671.1 putative protein serine/threonine kinase [Tieghemostelium lacteum]